MTLGTTKVSAQDWNNLAKYATGAAINHTEIPWYSGFGPMLVLQGGIWSYANRKDLKGGFKALGDEAKANKEIMNAAKTQTKGIKGIWQGTKDITNNNALVSLNKSLAQKGSSYKKVKTAVKTAIDNKDYTAATRKNVEKLKADANLKSYEKKANIQRTKGNAFTKALRWVKDKTGITKLTTKAKTLLSKNGTARTIAKGVKGGAGMAVISAAVEAPTVYETYKTLGKKAGNKQLAKSAVNIAAETAGWVVGLKAGAALGAALGSVVPGLGNAAGAIIGGVIGTACGILGSWLAGKASRAIVGKDEIEKAQEEQAVQLAQEAENDPELQQQLALAALEQLEAEGDNLSEDGKIAMESLEKVVNSIQTDDETSEETSDKTSKKISTKASAETSDETTTKASTKSNKTTSKSTTDAGLNALAGLAGSSSTGTTSVTNSYGSSAFNSFMMHNYTGYNSFNPFMMGGFSCTNPFIMNSYTGYNSFNPFMAGGYSGLNMLNPYQLYMAA